MKKLEMTQMENIIGEGKNRDCALMGILTVLSIPASFFTYGMATIATVSAATAMGCLD